jgi:hypothetical protein
MELSKLSRDELGERLEKRSAGELRKLASSHGVSIPASFDDKEAILDAIHGALSAPTSSASVSGVVSARSSAGASPSARASASEAEPRFRVLCVTGKSQLWKFGFKFTTEWQTLPKSKFSDEQWRVLSMDKRVRVQPVA